MIRTLSHTQDKTIHAAPEALHELRGFMLAHEDARGDYDTSWFQLVRSSLDFAIELTKEARDHFTESRKRDAS